MLLTFGDCELDTARFELRRAGQVQAVEPQVFSLLLYLVQQRHRVVGRAELLDTLWPGKVVGESALSSCVKAARRAIGDDGTAQRGIATVQRRGYRFVAAVAEPRAQASTPTWPEAHAPHTVPTGPRRASIAVMPFAQPGGTTAAPGGLADALVHDVITRLAQLRSLFVIAQGSVFALRDQAADPGAAARLLNVDYVVTGSVRHEAQRLAVSAELVEAGSGRIVWTEVFRHHCDAVLRVLEEIGHKVVASVASEVEAAERHRALLKPPNSLNAWEAHHRGLWHMYRFTQADNTAARQWFETALRQDPAFASAHAGLSFTHFQDAFQGWTARAPATERAFAAACQGLAADDRHPAAHWAMGRALWLRDQPAHAVQELERAVDLSPSFAMGHYTLAFIHAQSGDPDTAIACADRARQLSPFDPLLFGLLGARALALLRQERFAEAAHWATQAAARPNAHPHILGIAAVSLALAGELDAAQAQAVALRRQRPHYSASDFLAAFRLEPHGAALLRRGARLVGLA